MPDVCQDLVSCYFYFVYSLLDLSCCECDVISLFCMCLDLFVLCVACLTVFVKLLGETIRNVFGCGCYFVV